MKFIGDRWLSSLLIGAAITLAVGVVVTSTAPTAHAQEEESTESAPAAEESAAAESSGGDATAELPGGKAGVGRPGRRAPVPLVPCCTTLSGVSFVHVQGHYVCRGCTWGSWGCSRI